MPAPAFEDGNFVVQGGGVTSPQAAGCTVDGSLVLSLATSDSQGKSFTITRHSYPVSGSPLQFGSPRMTTDETSAAELSTRFPEFGTDNFAPCGGELGTEP